MGVKIMSEGLGFCSCFYKWKFLSLVLTARGCFNQDKTYNEHTQFMTFVVARELEDC